VTRRALRRAVRNRALLRIGAIDEEQLGEANRRGTNRASFGVARLEGGRGSGLDARRPGRYYGEGAAAHRHRTSRERNRPRLGESYEGRTSGTSIRNEGRHGHARSPAEVSCGRSGLNSFRIDRTNPRARRDSESPGPRPDCARPPTATSCRSSSKRARPGSGSRSTSARRAAPTGSPRDPRGRLDLRPERIGHGILAAQDARLMTQIGEAEIVLELCPTSNLLTKGASRRGGGPRDLPRLRRARQACRGRLLSSYFSASAQLRRSSGRRRCTR
jgi:Adenosine deaminase